MVTRSDDEGPWAIGAFARSLTSCSEHTVSAYASDVRGFAEWAGRLGVDRPAQVQRIHLRRYVSHLNTRKLARRSIARKAAALRRYFRWATRTGVVPTDPTLGLQARGGDGRLPRVLERGDLEVLLEGPAPDGEPRWRRCRDDAVLELLYGSGLRVSELCGLDVESVRLDTATVIVWGKGAKERRVPMSPPAVSALLAWLRTVSYTHLTLPTNREV